MNRQIELLSARRFLPLFTVQTMGAFVDNLLKSAFVMVVTFGTARGVTGGRRVAGPVVLPFRRPAAFR